MGSSDKWSIEDQEEFFKKIKRARTQKAFIIRARANHLFFTGNPEKIKAAISLYNYGIKECPTSDLLTSFYLMLARSYEALGEMDDAIAHYRKVITLENDESIFVRSTKAWSYFSLLVVTQKIENIYDEILIVLDSAKLILIEQKFIFHACKAFILKAKGRLEQAKKESKSALSLIEIKDSGLKNRKKLGLVKPHDFSNIINSLKEV